MNEDDGAGARNEEIVLRSDNGRDVRFRGRLIGRATSRRGAAQTQWTEILLHRTEGGRFVAQVIGHSTGDGHEPRRRVHVAGTEAELIEALGTGRVAKAAYAQAGIECIEDVR